MAKLRFISIAFVPLELVPRSMKSHSATAKSDMIKARKKSQEAFGPVCDILYGGYRVAIRADWSN